MGEVQTQTYICKICGKSCVSGKSLGGHMRIHLALIASFKKAARERDEINMDSDQEDCSYQLKVNSKDHQSNSANCDDFEDVDQNNNYELRENPRKSWRFSDAKHGVSTSSKNDEASCEECGKEFSSFRALSVHMRSHSIKSKKVHQCKECGKGFDSMRAVFGHMKSHPKRSRVHDESADSLSELEKLCPVRKKRSVIRYKSNPNSSFSDLNASDAAVSELEEIEEVAKSLIMLSMGVRDWSKFDSVAEPSGVDLVYVRAESVGKCKNVLKNDGEFVCAVDEKLKMSLSRGNANAFKDKNVSEFVGLDANLVGEDEMRVDVEVVDGELVRVENEMKGDCEVSDDGQFSVVNLAVKLDCVLNGDFLVATNANEASISNYFNEVSNSVQESGYEMKFSADGAKVEVLKDFEKKPGDNQIKHERLNVGFVKLESSKRKKRECPVCFKVFPSGQALGGHKRAHFTGFTESKNKQVMAVNHEAAVDELFDLNFPVTVDEDIKRDVGFSLWWTERDSLVLTN